MGSILVTLNISNTQFWGFYFASLLFVGAVTLSQMTLSKTTLAMIGLILKNSIIDTQNHGLNGNTQHKQHPVLGVLFCKLTICVRRDTQSNDTQHNDSHNDRLILKHSIIDTQNHGLSGDTEHKQHPVLGILFCKLTICRRCDTQPNDTQHYDSQNNGLNGNTQPKRHPVLGFLI
jgi:hypothetical protein